MTLTNELNWTELCEQTISKLNKVLKKDETTMFRTWFMERENLGYCFDYNLIYRCFKIWKELRNNLDHFVVISGREGWGKSTLAIQLAAWIDPGFTTENITYDAIGFIDILKKKADSNDYKPISAMILDEGTELLGRESANLTNRQLTKSFFIQRALKFCVMICIPNFHMLDSVVKHHRVRTLIEVIDRGKYKAIVGDGIKRVAKFGKDNKEVNGVHLHDGTFWHGYFHKEFPKTISMTDYEKHKHDKIKDALTKMKGESVEQKWIKVYLVAKEIGVKSDSIVQMVRKGELIGKQIGNKWYITMEEYHKLMSH